MIGYDPLLVEQNTQNIGLLDPQLNTKSSSGSYIFPMCDRFKRSLNTPSISQKACCQLHDSEGSAWSPGRHRCRPATRAALIIRTGFWGILYYIYNKNPQNGIKKPGS